MDSTHDNKGVNVEGDRLSNLPDDLIHKILSYVSIKQAIETSGLSTRWRYIWTSMPYLNFSSEEFHKLPDFPNFVTHVLSGRNNQIELSSIQLTFHEKLSIMAVENILNYASSHKLLQLNINCLPDTKSQIPIQFLNFQYLKNLTLSGCIDRRIIKTLFTWELSALTTLNLHHVTLSYDNPEKGTALLSNCANLKNLTLKDCVMTGFEAINLGHPGLSSLTLENGNKRVAVYAPQLKNLIISNWEKIHLISAPNLSSLSYKAGYYCLEVSADLLHLEKVDICISCPFVDKESADKIVRLLQQIHSVKFLTLNTEIIMSLSSSMELILHQPSPFTNLKSLKIYPAYITSNEESQPKISMSTEVKSFLLDGSSGATFTMVSHEEIRADMNVASAQKLMRDLQVILNQFKENSETDTDQDKAPMAKVQEQDEVKNHSTQPDKEVKGHFGEDLNEEMEKDVGKIISMVREITKVLTKLPTSHRAKLEAKFSCLCAEADTIMDNMMDDLKIRCDKNPWFKCLLFDELAITSQPSS